MKTKIYLILSIICCFSCFLTAQSLWEINSKKFDFSDKIPTVNKFPTLLPPQKIIQHKYKVEESDTVYVGIEYQVLIYKDRYVEIFYDEDGGFQKEETRIIAPNEVMYISEYIDENSVDRDSAYDVFNEHGSIISSKSYSFEFDTLVSTDDVLKKYQYGKDGRLEQLENFRGDTLHSKLVITYTKLDRVATRAWFNSTGKRTYYATYYRNRHRNDTLYSKDIYDEGDNIVTRKIIYPAHPQNSKKLLMKKSFSNPASGRRVHAVRTEEYTFVETEALEKVVKIEAYLDNQKESVRTYYFDAADRIIEKSYQSILYDSPNSKTIYKYEVVRSQ